MELPLFPLNSVLCPGVALPLHIFEPRYRLMIGRCLDRGEPFGAVLLTDGREVGPLQGDLATVGTTALIRQAGRYPDGRLDIVTIGGQRFRIERLKETSEPYLSAEVTLLGEPLGDARAARGLAHRVSRRFLRYLELLQPAFEGSEPEIEVELVVEGAGPAGESGDDPEPLEPLAIELEGEAEETAGGSGGADAGEAAPIDVMGGSTLRGTESLSDAERAEVLMAAARRLVTPQDPTALSYVLAGLVQIELGQRQALLEAPDTEARLRRLDSLLGREIDLLGRRLKPLVVDGRVSALRRN
ncbi:MAG TPA: LON peptidase substrate-binding domain-containing protein [Candidatus Limnocylindrales bacterium]|nr:LON peptidase substrate-binding domain-containing protein [Candidatus Limnocylindrales bacterium]